MFVVNQHKLFQQANEQTIEKLRSEGHEDSSIETSFNDILKNIKPQPLHAPTDINKVHVIMNVAPWNYEATRNQEVVIICHDEEYAMVMFVDKVINIVLMMKAGQDAFLFRLSDLESLDKNVTDVVLEPTDEELAEMQ